MRATPARSVICPGGISATIPLPGVGRIHCCPQEEAGSARAVVRHRMEVPRGRSGRSPRRPRAAIPLPSIASPSVEEDDDAPFAVVDHGILECRWSLDGLERPRAAVPLPCVAITGATKEDGDAANAVV